MPRITAPRPGELPPAQHQTVSVVDFHHLKGRVPEVHCTEHTIRALPDLNGAMERFPYMFDTNAVGVEVHLGGVATGLYQVTEGIHAVDIVLNRPLRPGEETELRYTTYFDYQEMPEPLFRRAVGDSMLRRVEISVVFDDDQLPEQVWQTEWDGYMPDSSIAREELAQLMPCDDLQPDSVMVARYCGNNIQSTTVGLRWQWPEGAERP
jgi:hypothetical protein